MINRNNSRGNYEENYFSGGKPSYDMDVGILPYRIMRNNSHISTASSHALCWFCKKRIFREMANVPL